MLEHFSKPYPVTAFLLCPSVEPFENYPTTLLIELLQILGVAAFLDPDCQCGKCLPELLLIRLHLDQRLSFYALAPPEFEAEKGEARTVLDLEADEFNHSPLLSRQCQSELSQAFSEYLGYPPLVFPVLKVISEPHEHDIALAEGLDKLLEPQVQCGVQADVCQHGGNYAALGRSGERIDYLAVFFKDSGFKPLADQVQERSIIDPLFQHPDEPLVVNMVEKFLDIGVNDPAKRPFCSLWLSSRAACCGPFTRRYPLLHGRKSCS